MINQDRARSKEFWDQKMINQDAQPEIALASQA